MRIPPRLRGLLRRPSLSVRTRITLVITLVAALGMAAVGVATYSVERQRVLSQVDQRLEGHLAAASALVSDPPTGAWESTEEALRTIMRMLMAGDDAGAVGIVNGAAALVPGVELAVDPAQDTAFVDRVVADTTTGAAVIGTYRGDGTTWRYLAVPVVVSGDGTPTVFALVYDLDRLLAETDLAATVYLVAASIAVVLIALVAWGIATRLLRPVRRMRETAERVSERSLAERLAVDGRDDVSDLAATMNRMLDRLDEALDAQRRLLGDVGHELKTPLTIVRGYLDVMDEADEADVSETRRLVVDELDRMDRLVRDIAGVAALQGPTPVAPVRTDMAELLAGIAQKAVMIEGARVAAGPFAEACADVDDDKVTQAVLQLVQNAATHGGGAIRLSSRVVDGQLEILVRDKGPGVPASERDAVFERFRRGTEIGRGEDGSGLGLSIVALIARGHGGSVYVADAVGGGALFVFSVPIAEPAVAAPAPELVAQGA